MTTDKPTKREVFVVNRRAYDSLHDAMFHQPGEWSETRRRAVKYVSADSVARLVEAARHTWQVLVSEHGRFVADVNFKSLHDALLEVAGDGEGK